MGAMVPFSSISVSIQVGAAFGRKGNAVGDIPCV